MLWDIIVIKCGDLVYIDYIGRIRLLYFVIVIFYGMFFDWVWIVFSSFFLRL